jgi:hypothetical protein
MDYYNDGIMSFPTAFVLAAVSIGFLLWWHVSTLQKEEPKKEPKPPPPPKPKEPKAPAGIFSDVEKEVQTLLYIIEEAEPKHSNVVVSAVMTKVLERIRKHDEDLAKYSTEVKGFGEAWDRYPK